MEIILFTLVGIALYFTSDAIVRTIEKRKGELLPNRSLIFFGIITVLALTTFSFLENYGPQLGLLPAKQSQQQAPKTNAPQQETTPPKPARNSSEIPQ